MIPAVFYSLLKVNKMRSLRLIRCLSFLLLPIIAPSILAIRDSVPVDVETRPLTRRGECSDSFVAHELDHITTPAQMPVGFYDSNGAGVAINDLDNDGWLDLVFANLAGDSAIFWNRGGLHFDKEPLPSTNSARAANIVDVDGDGWLDIVFTQSAAAPRYWRNQQGSGFHSQILNGVSYIGYAMNWLDADADGDLDLITGSYDVENEMLLGQSAPRAGVIYYENRGRDFRATRLANRSNTLAILTSLNPERRHEVIIGNDFAVEDRYFVYENGAWQETPPMSVMPHSTMSYDAADLNNNGQNEIFAVDMKPYAQDEAMLAQWQPVMDMMMAMPHPEGDPQIMENVLYAADSGGLLENIAPQLALDATGWSWSSQFGDLDNDGFQDLYVVNGMISVELFSHLPNNELVEENQVYRSLKGERFIAHPSWELNDKASGRGMSMADLDNDGDLDIAVNNLLSPAKIFENRLCASDSIEIDLRWNGSKNSHAIGSQLILQTDKGAYRRDVTAASGYLSGDASRAHIGLPVGAAAQSLTIIWNDGGHTALDAPQANTLITVTRG